MYHYRDYGGNDDIFSLLYLLFWLVLILMGALITVHYLRRDFGGKPKEDPIAVLKTRYAKGEIDKKEFEQKKKDLKK